MHFESRSMSGVWPVPSFFLDHESRAASNTTITLSKRSTPAMSNIFLPPSHTRLLTIAAHVDHGKTTLADNLIEHNGLISERLAGTLRYLDSDPEEQRRGITMRASAIGLKHEFKEEKYIIHILDSPGHADFSHQVSSSLLACDIALIVVDAVEGMGPRTHQVLREAKSLYPILVINKVDRLCTDLGLTPTEAYLRLQRLLESIHAATVTITGNEDTFNTATNVVFASALFGWGFSCSGLARSLFRSKQLPIKPMVLKQCLFSDVKFKDGKLLKWKSGMDDPPLFVQYALEPLWRIYHSGGNMSDDVVDAMSVAPTGKRVPSSLEEVRQVLSRTGAQSETAILRALLRRYRPLADGVLDVVCEVGPPPRGRVLRQPEDPIPADFDSIQSGVRSCSVEGHCVAHIYKFMAAETAQIARDPVISSTSGDKIILGVCRVLSGSLKTGESYFVFGPKYEQGSERPTRKVRLYLLMGSSFVLVDKVPAGHLCAVANLDDTQLKTLTLSDSEYAMPLALPDDGVRPLVKVNVEAKNPVETDILERGLMKLSLGDASVEVTATRKGERILACLGELHLEQAILELKRVYCEKEIDIRTSDPIIDFGESTDWFDNELDFEAFFKEGAASLHQTKIPPYNEEEGIGLSTSGRARAIVSGKCGAVSLRCVPLSADISQCLAEKSVVAGSEESLIEMGKALGLFRVGVNESAVSVLDHMLAACIYQGINSTVLIEGPHIMDKTTIVCVPSTSGQVFVPSERIATDDDADANESAKDSHDRIRETIATAKAGDASLYHDLAVRTWSAVKGSIIAGFQVAMRAGPFCEEPIHNVLTVVEAVEIALHSGGNGESPVVSKGFTGGPIMSAVKAGIRCSLLTRPARLIEGYLKLTLHSTLTGLGSLYSVLGRRRGKVLEDTMIEGTDLLLITALVPQAEAFGLAPELFGKTSGTVTAPEMNFSHWARLDVDPFWVPTSEEEKEDYGDLQVVGDLSTGIDNAALKYIRMVRKQKGLAIDSGRTVLNAEKQRTLKR